MAETKGDVKINGKWYRIDLPSYRDRDVVDFSPRAATPGASIIHSELMLYQPLLQTDWRHGFGFVSYDDPSGYLKSVGNIDTRHEGKTMMFTNKVENYNGTWGKWGGVNHTKAATGLNVDDLYFYGNYGIKRIDWNTLLNSTVYPLGAGVMKPVDTMFSLGTNLFACFRDTRIIMSALSGKVQVQPDENASADTFLSENAPTVNYGTDEGLLIGTDVTTKHNTAYIKFDLSQLPVGAVVTKAELTLKVDTRTTTVPNLKVARCLRAVDEATATWNIYSTGNNWQTAGAKGALDRSADILFNGAMTSQARQFFTMSLDATKFADLVADNKGLLIWEEYAGAEIQNVKFCAATETNYDWRPYLIIEYTLAGDWVNTGKDANSKGYHWEVTHNGFAYLGVKDTNRVHYSSDPALTDLEGTSADPSAILVGSSTVPTISGISYMGSLYVAKADGLWQIGDDKIARRVLDFTSEQSQDNFKSMVVHNGYLVFSVRDVLYQWNGSRLTSITPPSISETWPYLSYGQYANLVAVGNFLYCTARTNEELYTESLLCYDGVGWHKLSDIITNGYGRVSMLFFDPRGNRLWYHKDLGNVQITDYISFQARSEYPYASFPTTGTHVLYTSKHDMGFARVYKSTPSLLVEAYNCSATNYLTIKYSLDEGAWVTWGTITANGVTELSNPGGLHTIEYKRIALQVQFTTATATISPILEGLTLRFLMRPDLAFGWNFNIVAADEFVYGEYEDTRTAWGLLSDLRTARESKAPIEFIDIDGQTYWAYLTAYSRTAQERNADEENDEVSSIESVINVNIIEAK